MSWSTPLTTNDKVNEFVPHGCQPNEVSIARHKEVVDPYFISILDILIISYSKLRMKNISHKNRSAWLIVLNNIIIYFLYFSKHGKIQFIEKPCDFSFILMTRILYLCVVTCWYFNLKWVSKFVIMVLIHYFVHWIVGWIIGAYTVFIFFLYSMQVTQAQIFKVFKRTCSHIVLLIGLLSIYQFYFCDLEIYIFSKFFIS